MGSKSTKTETTENREPPAWAKPLLTRSADDAMKAYEDNVGFGVYQGSTVAPRSDATTASLNRLESAATGPMQALAGNATRTLGNYDAAYNKLEDTASGRMLDSNPYFDKVVDRAARDTAALTNSAMSGAGRYGSGAHAGVLADRIGGLQDQMRSSQYNTERDRQLTAVNNQAAITSNKLSGVGQALGMQSAPGNALAAVGQARDADAQARLSDEIQRFYSEEQQPWARIGALQAAGAGSALDYGTASRLTRETSPINPLGLIGGLTSTFAGFPGFGGLFGLGGAGAGGFVNAIGPTGAAFSAYSDARLKQDLRKVGTEPKHGLPVYEFSYRGSTDRHRGLLAQDVERVVPEAVIADDDGFLLVDYGKLGIDPERLAA